MVRFNRVEQMQFYFQAFSDLNSEVNVPTKQLYLWFYSFYIIYRI